MTNDNHVHHNRYDEIITDGCHNIGNCSSPSQTAKVWGTSRFAKPFHSFAATTEVASVFGSIWLATAVLLPMAS